MFKIEINTDGAAFEDACAEIGRLLRETADRFAEMGPVSTGVAGSLRDINGNACGTWEYAREGGEDDDDRVWCVKCGAELLASASGVMDSAGGQQCPDGSEHAQYDHEPRPDDDPESGDRCKDCGEDVTWEGPSDRDWLHTDDLRNLVDIIREA